MLRTPLTPDVRAMTTPYCLPQHVHFCRRGDAFVFLNLRKDDYTLIDGDIATAFRNLCSDTTGDEPVGQPNCFKELEQDGLLTTAGGNRGRAIEPTKADRPIAQLVELEQGPRSPVSPRQLVSFLIASSKAALQLRFGRLENTVRGVEKRKARHAGNAAADLERARHLTVIFHQLRSYFPAPYLCLYDSLALVHFLASFGLFPDWIFGIRLEPWAAHCWVQQNGIVFNEVVEEAAGYTPVMVV